MHKILSFVLFCILVFHFSTSSAFIKISIDRGNFDPMPIAILKFSGSLIERDTSPATEIIKRDLESTGLFKVLSNNSLLEKLDIWTEPSFTLWKKLDTAAIIVGHVQQDKSSKFISLQIKAWDPYSETCFLDITYQNITPRTWRKICHKISDMIYSRLTGESGYFDSKIIFVSESGHDKNRVTRIAYCDVDGKNLQYLTNGAHLVLTPRFHPQGRKIIYMSYRDKIPKIYLMDLTEPDNSNKTSLLGQFPGISFAPRFSPDGNYVIFSIAKEGSTNIYELHIESRKMTQITYGKGKINTSPSYSPDGKNIVFNSDRAGLRQLYIVNRNGSNIRRISKGAGSYATPVWSPKGNWIAFTKILHGQFYIGVMRSDGTGERLLTKNWIEDGPHWSPNGRTIVFNRQYKSGARKIYSIDLTGYNEKPLPIEGQASNVAWSPLLP